MTVVKGIVVCLALANIGYFLWARGVGRADEVADASPAAVLRLASEVAQAARGGAPGAEHGAAQGRDAGVTPGDGARADSARADGTRADGARGDGAVTDTASRCVSVGPFRDAGEVSHALGALRGRGYAPRQRAVASDVPAGVWIYLPIPTGGTGAQLLADLKAAGVKDALEMPGPQRVPVISLGLYDEAGRGQLRVAQLQKLGFTASVAERRHPGNSLWADVDLKPGENTLTTTDLQQAGRISRLEVRDCAGRAGVS